MSLATLFPLMSVPFVSKWFQGSLNVSALVQLGLLVACLKSGSAHVDARPTRASDLPWVAN
ncbi:hypothetical protein VE00_11116 [Pseudogymnoascus sp. WSF 3629]|nr:hypothetical protein VE00_11116 [Pseudogymnoascus sp. WSF 3629]